ncbi:hypothetical protein [Sinomonas sp. P47F7]|uniref:hypothetical protein n=1 Tax=Sinomonas sp. P47F7 TaxID=3410987 RepID=UPI003BF5876A
MKWFGAAAQAYKSPLLLEPTSNEQRILVSCDESFLGILMTIRADDTSDIAQAAAVSRQSWMHRLLPLRTHGTGTLRGKAD